MAYFLDREEPARKSGKRCSNGGGVSAQSDTFQHADPSSPLSKFVRDGYNGMPSGGRQPQRPSEGGFDAGVAQQWSGNVQHNMIAHQQQHDPNFVQKQPQTHGLRVSQAAGGQSSLSLAWDDPPAEQPGRRGRGSGAQQPASHSVVGGTAFNNGVQHRADPTGGVAGVMGGASYGDAAYARPASHTSSRVSAQAYGANVAGPSGNLSHQEAYAVSANRQRGAGGHGGAGSGGQSYGGANGNGSQNTGNHIGDRNSSRVLAPPGGFSSFSLG